MNSADEPKKAGWDFGLRLTQRRWRHVLGPGALLVAVIGFHACHSTDRPTFEELMTDANAVFVDSVRSAVDDPARAEQALELFDSYQSDEADFFRRAREMRSTLFELNARHDAPRAEFEALFVEFEDNREELAGALVRTLGELKSVITPDEWMVVLGAMRGLDENWEAVLH